MHTLASPKAPLSLPTSDHLSERSRRAREEPMSVRPLGNACYEVESADGDTYLVNLTAGRCTCPDHGFREVRCKHLRRVALEINEGRTPPPGEIAVPCHDCDGLVFVPEDATGPAYCDAHALQPGDTVRDRETGDRLTVVSVSDLRADSVLIREVDCPVAEYGPNADYGPDVPVVAAVYPHARVQPNGVVPCSLKIYAFPRTRLERVLRSGLPRQD